jgi:hypothetical protein
MRLLVQPHGEAIQALTKYPERYIEGNRILAKAGTGARLYSPADRLRLLIRNPVFQFGTQCAPNL